MTSPLHYKAIRLPAFTKEQREILDLARKICSQEWSLFIQGIEEQQWCSAAQQRMLKNMIEFTFNLKQFE